MVKLFLNPQLCRLIKAVMHAKYSWVLLSIGFDNNFCFTDAEIDDDLIFVMAEYYLQQWEHPKMARKGPDKFWSKTWAQTVQILIYNYTRTVLGMWRSTGAVLQFYRKTQNIKRVSRTLFSSHSLVGETGPNPRKETTRKVDHEGSFKWCSCFHQRMAHLGPTSDLLQGIHDDLSMESCYFIWFLF